MKSLYVFSAAPCHSCGSFKRYRTSGSCVECVRAKAIEKGRERHPLIDRGIPSHEQVMGIMRSKKVWYG